MTDYQGLTNVITATGALISSIGVIVLGVLKYRSRNDLPNVEAKVDAVTTKVAGVQETVNGHSERILASNEALKAEVINLQTTGATTPSKMNAPDAPVTLDRGVVSTDK